MVRGLYTAYTGMVNEQNRLDIITNNLANSATVGYKVEGVTNQSFKDVLTVKINDGSEAYADKAIGSMNQGVKLGEVYTDYTQGSLRNTGNTYDLGIGGQGFFSVSVKDKDGNESTKYTRNGNFTVSKEGYIVDSDGNNLQGESGNIQIPPNSGDVIIDTDGTIYADDVRIDQIKLTDFEDYNYLKKFGNTMYETVDGAVTKDATGIIEQGYTEQSNVNTVSQMVQMITISRSYEANQKVISSIDNMLGQAVGSVGKV